MALPAGAVLRPRAGRGARSTSWPCTTATRCATAPSSTIADGSQNCWDSGGDENLRREREKLLVGLLLTSQGVPILLQGDEFGATKSGAADQEGARNSYNYEAEPPDPAIDKVNLVDWRLLDGDNSRPQRGRPTDRSCSPGPGI